MTVEDNGFSKKITCLCGGIINRTANTRNIRGCRMAGFPSHPCADCGLLHWDDDGNPVQCHNDGAAVLAYAVGKKGHEFREVPADFLMKKVV